jgi:hypothetical protein
MKSSTSAGVADHEITGAQTTLLYPPSWVDRLMRAVDRLPGPYWLAYLLFALVESLLIHAAAWLDGTMPPWTLQPMLFLFPSRTWLTLALMTFLNDRALQALRNFRPLLASDKEEAQLRHRLTTMPALPVLLVNFIGFSYFLILVLFRPIEGYQNRPLLTPAYLISGFILFSVGSTIYLHSSRQLLLVHRIYANVRTFNLFQLQPVYAFSNLTALTGGAYILLFSLTLLLFPFPVSDIRSVGSNLLQVVLVVLAFVLPLWQTHRRLLAEKQRLQGEVDRRLEAAFQQLHHAVRELEPQLLSDVPTWPWQPATLRSLLTALVVPLALFVAQLILERWLTS